MIDQDETQVRHNISRILLISPEQSELFQRNRSRIFVWPAGESIINTVLFQSQRPIESFIPAVERALRLSDVRLDGNEDVPNFQLIPYDRGNNLDGLIPHHLLTNGWLTIDKTVFDMVIEIDISGEILSEPDGIVSTNAIVDQDNPLEDPLIFMTGISDVQLVQESSESQQQNNVVEIPKQTQAEPVAQENRAAMAARQPQDRDGQLENQRQSGKPGRVRNPALDRRLMANRSPRAPQSNENRERSTKSSRK